MHMPDSLISPVVGGVMLAASGGIMAYSVKKSGVGFDSKKIPLAGVMGAFVFACQMVNFTIPPGGASGHLSGGLLLAAVLGPALACLTMAVVLLIQALFFADGGLLAFGCNVFNLAFFSCFIAYPYIYKAILRGRQTKKRIFLAAVPAGIAATLLGAFSVVMQALFSNKTELPFWPFLLSMQGIHLAIGAAEGLITAAVLIFITKARPEILEHGTPRRSIKQIVICFAALALVIGSAVSLFASTHPDGMEWSIEQTATQEIETQTAEKTEAIQDKIAWFPDYGGENLSAKSLAGLTGGAATLVVALGLGFLIKRMQRNGAREHNR